MNTPSAPLPPASEAVRREWLQRVEAEYRSSVLTQYLTLWMTQAGVSPDLVQDGLRIAADELDHADLSMEAHRAAGGEGVPLLARESLTMPLRPGETLEAAIVRVGVDAFCLGETVAVPLFRHLREGCDVPVARAALDRILKDEVRHRDFGWDLLAWMLEAPSHREVRAQLDRDLPQWFARIRGSYAPAFSRALTEIDEADRRWGLMAPAQYAEVVERTWERDWRPRFAHLGIAAERAWEASTPTGSRAS